ncbi:MAG: hypothetical protein KatS3mg019_1218 [Fimbriimonadales bacterium]|nr:MAG: hypothetical protein KatS3mg019_1218 [Fimbriimonadales bacterium]
MVEAGVRLDYMEQPAWGVWLAGLERSAPGEAIENALRWLVERTQSRQGILLLPDPRGEQVEFAYVAGERATELRGFRVRPQDTILEPTLLRREFWEYHAQTHQEPIGAITTGLAAPLPTLPLSAVALLNRPEPYESSHRALLTQFATPLELFARLSRALQQLEQRERALKWLGRLPQRLGSELSVQRALEAVESLMRKAAPEGGGV